MIELIKAGKYYPTEMGRHFVFRDVSLKLPLNANIGIIGPNGAGKSTLLRLLAGGDIPSEGQIVRTGRISWPLGLTPGLQATLTGAENARFAGRIYGMSSAEIRAAIEKIREIAGIGKFFDLAVRTYSSGMRQRLSFAISMSMDFDYYLFDEISAGGDRNFKLKASAMIKQRLKTSNFIVVTHDLKEVRSLCQSVILMGKGQLLYFDDVRDGIRAYSELFGPPRKVIAPVAAAPAKPVRKMAEPPAKVAPSATPPSIARTAAPAPGAARLAPRRTKPQEATPKPQQRLHTPQNPPRRKRVDVKADLVQAKQQAETQIRMLRKLQRRLKLALAAGTKARSSPEVHALQTTIQKTRQRAQRQNVRVTNLQRRAVGTPRKLASPGKTPSALTARNQEPTST